MTTDERYRRVRELFERAHDLPADDRATFVARECTGDPALADEVLSLLRIDAFADENLERPAGEAVGADQSLVGTSLGGFAIQALIATGGMGAVYRARQDQPNREVALKVIRTGAVTPQVLRRFELESEVLGRLDHPGIAKVFAASTAETDRGRVPFFAMELISGQPLTGFAEERRLELGERVQLLARVCEAVHHAHQNGVIHRDLKPANILVGQDGQPKVLDFGVARITDADLRSTTLATREGLIVGTLAYMSPEQVHGLNDEVDIRTDIYALGVVGYELLTGELPLDLAGRSWIDAAMRITTEAPRSLSSAGRSFPTDLETIIGTCLEKDKDLRYGSAAQLAADLRRYLADEPVLARPPSLTYQMAKFARRNRGLVVGASLALAALLLGLVVSLSGWSAASRARTRAETEAAKATLLNAYLTDMLQAPDPWQDGREVKVIDLLDRASEQLEPALADQPEVAALAHHRLGCTYQDLGQYEQAEQHLGRALELSAEAPGVTLAGEVDMLADLGYVHIAQSELDDAEAVLGRALERAATGLEERHPTRLKLTHQLAVLRWEQGDLDEAERLFRRCLEGSLSALGPEAKDTIVTTAALGNVLQQARRLDEAKPLLEGALRWNLEHHGEDHPSTAIVVNNLALVYQQLEQHERALEMFERSLATRRRVHGGDSVSVLVGLNNLGLQLGMMGRAGEALPHLEEAMDIASRVLEPGHWRWPALRSTYGRTLTGVGRYDDAERELLASLRGFRATVGEDHWRVQAVCRSLVELYHRTGDVDAEARYRAVLQDDGGGATAS